MGRLLLLFCLFVLVWFVCFLLLFFIFYFKNRLNYHKRMTFALCFFCKLVISCYGRKKPTTYYLSKASYDIYQLSSHCKPSSVSRATTMDFFTYLFYPTDLTLNNSFFQLNLVSSRRKPQTLKFTVQIKQACCPIQLLLKELRPLTPPSTPNRPTPILIPYHPHIFFLWPLLTEWY